MDSNREIWREARRHIGEYEARTSELTLDLQAEAKALQAAKDELASIRREAQAQNAAKDAANQDAVGEVERMQALHQKRADELAESSRLTLQVASLRQALEEARAKAAEQGRSRDEHLASMAQHLQGLRAYGEERSRAGAGGGGGGGAAVAEPAAPEAAGEAGEQA